MAKSAEIHFRTTTEFKEKLLRRVEASKGKETITSIVMGAYYSHMESIKNGEIINTPYKYSDKSKKELISIFRSKLSNIINNKYKGIAKTIALKYIGCSREDLIKHIKSKFTEGMNWENYGVKGWHIDHIIPISSFDLSKEEEVYVMMNYINLQPLWAKDNIRKRNKIPNKDKV